MKYLLRLLIIPLVYLVCFAFTTTGITSIDGFSPLVKSLISLVLLLVYIFIMFTVMVKEGQDAYGILISNDAQRRRIVETGVVVDFETTKEYRPWKGFAVGAICCIPLVVMVLLHLIAFPRGDTSTVSLLCEMIYGVFFSIVRTYQNANEAGFFIISGVVLILFPLMTGIPYAYGARVRREQQEKVKKLNSELHGE